MEARSSACGQVGAEADWITACFDETLSTEAVTHGNWDCVLLFIGPSGRDRGFPQRIFLIIEWKGTTGDRVGWIQIDDDREGQFDTVMTDAPQQTKRIALG
jgi:hypothetical protein